MEVKNKELILNIKDVKSKDLLDFILNKIDDKVLRWAIVNAEDNKIKIEMSVLK